MTPEERDLITKLLSRLEAQGNRPKDPEAEALIGRAMSAQRDAPYLLVQTVLIQDMALAEAQARIGELERRLATTEAATPPQPTRFLDRPGPWGSPAPPSPARPVWTQSGVAAAPPPAMAAPPAIMPGTGSSFLGQAAATALGVAGGALLFQSVQSLFGPHYGGGFLGGMPMQPALSETVINNYYGTPAGGPGAATSGTAPDPSQDYASDQDLADTDFSDQDFDGDGGGGGGYDV